MHTEIPTSPFFLVHGGFQGNLHSNEEIISFAEHYKPELLAAPDIYRDQKTTFSLIQEFSKKCPDELMKRTVAIYQGGIAEMEDIKKYKELGFSWLGIPSDNETAIDFIPEFKKDFKIHILGGHSLVSNIILKVDSIDIVTNDYSQFSMIMRWSAFLSE